ncbi:MAG: exodeoxyribonuclease VII large subunit, partial [Bryobacteraceae bacterium]|nr:exodeoxyribonuclease VII large subunit [Bryobacteraceae bacterium]
ASEGLFDATRKRALPKYPTRIGIVSSPAGAVIQDIVQILSRRFPGIHIRLYPTLVQGEGAAAAISRGIGYFSRSGWPQVVIVARGGGSLEDLWAFNEESVARAIAACSVPVISAIGHETDFTIADFVADLRAPTPSAAAGIVICTRQELLDGIAACVRKMEQALRYRLAAAGRRLHEQGVDRATTVLHRRIGRFSQRVDELEYALRDRLRNALLGRGAALSGLEQRLRRMDLRLRFGAAHRRLAFAHAEAIQAMRFRLTAARGRFEPLDAQLVQLSPLRVLDRGYAIVLDERGEILKDAAQTSPGAQLEIRLSRGRVGARVTEQKS